LNPAPIGGQPVRVPEGRGIAEAVALVLYIFALGLPFLAYVALSVRQVSLEYRLSGLVAQRQELSRDHERLALQKAAMVSPSQVDRVATGILGMVPEGPSEPSLQEAAP
jgi:cell division protein FtsL